jgi:hypothetical protein
MGRDPKSFLELFEFLVYSETKGRIQEASMQMAKARIGAER